MLRLAKLGRGREDYYLRAIGADASQYYSEHGEVAGLWLGGGAEELGLLGRVDDAALLAVLAGYGPGARRGLARLLHGRQEQADQDGDDGDHHQQLDQGKTSVTVFQGKSGH